MKQVSEAKRHAIHECKSSHVPKDLACPTYKKGMNGRCVYCDHEERCHPGPNTAGPLGHG